MLPCGRSTLSHRSNAQQETPPPRAGRWRSADHRMRVWSWHQAVKVVPQAPAPVAGADTCSRADTRSDRGPDRRRRTDILRPARRNWRSAISSAPKSSSIARSIRCSNRRTARAATRDCVSTSIAWSIASASSNRRRSPPATASRKPSPNRRRSTRCWPIETFESTSPKPATAETVQADLAVDDPRHSDSDQRSRAALRRAVSGPAARIPDRRACRAACSTCR